MLKKHNTWRHSGSRDQGHEPWLSDSFRNIVYLHNFREGVYLAIFQKAFPTELDGWNIRTICGENARCKYNILQIWQCKQLSEANKTKHKILPHQEPLPIAAVRVRYPMNSLIASKYQNKLFCFMHMTLQVSVSLIRKRVLVSKNRHK